MTAISLNQGQQEAATAFFQFLFSTDFSFIISGPGGTGKTHLMSYLIDRVMPQYFDSCRMLGIEPEYDEVVMTATTNKAAEVLAVATQRPTQTIHSFLNLKVVDDYETGVSKITKNVHGWMVHEKKIIFIDECSMIDGALLNMLREATHQCKVVYVGDHCQLPPVMEPISPIYKTPSPFYALTEPMRNAGQPALMDICNQLRATVETGMFAPIKVVPGVIDHLDDDQMQAEIIKTFRTQTTDHRILAYTNGRVMLYNDFIRGQRQLPDEYTEGEFLVNNSAIRLKNGMLSVEEEVTITHQGPKTSMFVEEGVEFHYRECTLTSRVGMVYLGVKIPCDRSHFDALLRYYKRIKHWAKYYNLKNTFPDLRQRDAATVHKSQGSTYETVFIDLNNISTCHNPNMAARMLYVAFSRARSRIFLYGNLAPKYGGLIG